MEQDWDLHAVVRGCSTLLTSSTTTTTTTTASSSSSSSGFGNCYLYPESASSSSSSSPCGGGGFSSIFDYEQEVTISQQVLSLNPIEDLHELCKPFFTTKSQPQFQTSSSPLSSSFSYSSLPSPPKQPLTQEKQQQQQQQHRSKNLHSGGSLTTPRSKRRKNQLKKVCQVPVENLSLDIWAWRKYGQKPIKGSPYPRGYYRCSSSKGCLARKQVERNRSDPTMFIVTYTAEHNHPAPTHRNSLTGSTRQKPQSATTTTTTCSGGGAESETEKASEKPELYPVTPLSEEEASPQREKSESREEKEDLMEDEDEFGVCDMVLPDDFFESLDELGQFTGTYDANSITAGGDFFTDPFSAMAIPSWLSNSVAATAAGSS